MFKPTIVSFFNTLCYFLNKSCDIWQVPTKYPPSITIKKFKYKNHRFLFHVILLAIGIIKIKHALVPPHIRSYSSYAHGLKHYPTLKTLLYFVNCI
jgi:hypothetical protein